MFISHTQECTPFVYQAITWKGGILCLAGFIVQILSYCVVIPIDFLCCRDLIVFVRQMIERNRTEKGPSSEAVPGPVLTFIFHTPQGLELDLRLCSKEVTRPFIL